MKVKSLLPIALMALSFPFAADASSPYVVRTIDQGRVRISPVSAADAPGWRLRASNAIHPNRHYRALYTPNDPQLSLQWDFNVLNVQGAWDAAAPTPFFGDARVVVAVLDTGVAYKSQNGFVRSPDLDRLKVWTNTEEVAGNGLDDDHDGLIDDVSGWNFVDNNNSPLDNHGHGTHIASIIAGSTDNAVATAGLAPNVTLMPLKVLDQNGSGTTLTISRAVEYAIEQGANIINLSLGGEEPDEVLLAAIQRATAEGVIVVAASGNDGAETLNYPARYAETLSVGASQFDGNRAPYSNTGPELDVIAPGGNIALDQNGDQQVDGIPQMTCRDQACDSFAIFYYTGTSQAAAHAAGTAALLESCALANGRQPAASRQAILDAISGTATDIGTSGKDVSTGDGLINTQAALSELGCVSGTPLAPGNLVVRARKNSASLPLTRAYPFNQPLFSWSGTAGGTYHISWKRVGQSTATTSTTTETTYQPSITTNGTYELSVTTTVDGQTSQASVARYKYRAPNLTIGEGAITNFLSLAGKKVRSVKVRPNTTGVTGGAFLADGTDRIVVTTPGTVTIYRTNGQKVLTLHPFGKNSKLPLESVILRRSGQAAFLAASSSSINEVRIFDASGKIRKRLTLKVKSQGQRLASGDVDGDGTDELVVADRSGAAVRLYSISGRKKFAATPRGKKYGGGWSVAAGDVNGDGKSEILGIPADARRNPPVYVISGAGKTLRVSVLKKLRSPGAFSLTAADTDGDGREEILIYAAKANSLSVWSQRGTRIKNIRLSRTKAVRVIGRLQ